MKFDTKVYCKKDGHLKHWLLGVRFTPLVATFSIFMKKEWYRQSANTYNPVLMTSFLNFQ